MRRFAAARTVALALLVCTWVIPAQAAAPTLPTGPWKTLTVAVLPVVYLGGLADPFADAPENPELRSAAARWHRGIEVAFQGRDQIGLVGSAEIRERLSRQTELRRTLELAQERYALGLEQWRALRAKEALSQLDRSKELYLEAFSDLADPRVVADVELHRGLALIDLGQVGPAHIAFAQMFALDPTRRFERGYYGAPIEQELAGAAHDITSLPTPSAILWPAERLAALAKRLGVDVIAIGLIDAAAQTSGGAPQRGSWIELALFDARSGGFTLRESFELGDAMADDLDRAISAWHSCVLEAPRTFGRPPAPRRWYVDFGYIHSVWLNHRRTRNFVNGPGAHIGVTFIPTPGLELWAKTSQRATLSDANNDLLDVFTTTHIAAGAGLGIGGGHLTFSLRAGIEVALSMADIAMTTDVDCKFFGSANSRCGSIFRAESPAVWLGLDFSATLRYAPTRAWYLGFSAGTTIYAVSGNLVGELNFPLYGTFGFGLPF